MWLAVCTVMIWNDLKYKVTASRRVALDFSIVTHVELKWWPSTLGIATSSGNWVISFPSNIKFGAILQIRSDLETLALMMKWHYWVIMEFQQRPWYICDLVNGYKPKGHSLKCDIDGSIVWNLRSVIVSDIWVSFVSALTRHEGSSLITSSMFRSRWLR